MTNPDEAPRPKATLSGHAGQRARHPEQHRIKTIGWLRAAVLGANDGIVSTASLMLGVAGAGSTQHGVLIAGVASLVGGAMSMATGEYVSVSSQADAERAALNEEQHEIEDDSAGEHRELTAIYVRRGLEMQLAQQVASQLMAHDALGAHARDELGISEISTARPLQAAGASAGSFAAGAALPLATVALVQAQHMTFAVAAAALVALALLGGLAAKAGGGSVWHAAFRVTFWSALAMAVTFAVGAFFGTGAS